MVSTKLKTIGGASWVNPPRCRITEIAASATTIEMTAAAASASSYHWSPYRPRQSRIRVRQPRPDGGAGRGLAAGSAGNTRCR